MIEELECLDRNDNLQKSTHKKIPDSFAGEFFCIQLYIIAVAVVKGQQ